MIYKIKSLGDAPVKKKINRLINIIIFCFIGQFIGSGLYDYWHFRKYPGLYEMQSAPWYTSILANGLFTLLLLTVCIIVKAIFIENLRLIKKTALILGIIFLFLTFTGGGYVLINHGQVNAGYAGVPGIFSITCFAYYRKKE